MLHLDSLLMEPGASEPWCCQCQQLRQQLDTANQEHLVNFKALKEKIYSTDLLIKKYNTKCREYDAQTKKLEDTTKRLEVYQRDLEVMTSKLKSTLEQVEPLTQAREKLEKKRTSLEKQVEELTNQMSSSELIQRQYMLTQQKLEKEVISLEEERKQLKQKVKDLENGVKKAETTQKRLQDDHEAKRQALSEHKKTTTRLTKVNQKLESQLAKYEELLRLNGLHVDQKKTTRRSGALASSEVCSITSSIAHTANLLSEQESSSESDEDVERIFAHLGFGVGRGSAVPVPQKSLLKPILPALSPLPCSPAPSKVESSSDSESESGEESSDGGDNEESVVCKTSGIQDPDTMDMSQGLEEKVSSLEKDSKAVDRSSGTQTSRVLKHLTRFQKNAELAAQASKLRSQRVRKLVTTDDEFLSRRHSRTLVLKGASEEGGQPGDSQELKPGNSGTERSNETDEPPQTGEEAESTEGTPLFSPKRRTSRFVRAEPGFTTGQDLGSDIKEEDSQTTDSRMGETMTPRRLSERRLSKQTTGSFDTTCLSEKDEETLVSSKADTSKQENSGVDLSVSEEQNCSTLVHVDTQIEQDLEISTSEDEMSPVSPRRVRLSPRSHGSQSSPGASQIPCELLRSGVSGKASAFQRHSPRFSPRSSVSESRSDGEPGKWQSLSGESEDEGSVKEASAVSSVPGGSDTAGMEGLPTSQGSVLEEDKKVGHIDGSGTDSYTIQNVDKGSASPGNQRQNISSRTRTRSLTKYIESNERSNSVDKGSHARKGEDDKFHKGSEANATATSVRTLDNETKTDMDTTEPPKPQEMFKKPFPVEMTTQGEVPAVSRRVTRSKSLPGFAEAGRGPKLGVLTRQEAVEVQSTVDIDKEVYREASVRPFVQSDSSSNNNSIHNKEGLSKMPVEEQNKEGMHDTDLPFDQSKVLSRVKGQKGQSEDTAHPPQMVGSSQDRIIESSTKKEKLQLMPVREGSKEGSTYVETKAVQEGSITGDKVGNPRIAALASTGLNPESPCHKILSSVTNPEDGSLQSPTSAGSLPFSPSGVLSGLPLAISPLPPTPMRRSTESDTSDEKVISDVISDMDISSSEKLSNSYDTKPQVKKSVGEVPRRTTQLIEIIPPPTKAKQRRRGRRLKEEMVGVREQGQAAETGVVVGEEGDKPAEIREECSKKGGAKKTTTMKPMISFVKGADTIPGTIENSPEDGKSDTKKETGVSSQKRYDIWVEASQGSQGSLSQPVQGESPEPKQKKERHKKKRQREAAALAAGATQECSPPKKALMQDASEESIKQFINIIDRELRSLERSGHVDLSQTAEHLVCLKGVVETGVFADRMLQLLQKSEVDLLMSEVGAQLKALESDPNILSKWTPTLHQMEERLVEVLVLAGEKMPYLPDLFLTKCAKAIIHSDSLHVLAKSALCRVYASVCQKLGQSERLRVLVYDLTYFKVTGVYALLANCAVVWPDALRVHKGSEELIVTVLQFIFLKNKFFRGTPKQQVTTGVLQRLCCWQHTELEDTQIVTKATNKMEGLCERTGSQTLSKAESDELFMCVQSLRLLAAHKGWQWTYTSLIQDTVCPRVRDYTTHLHTDTASVVTWSQLEWISKLLAALVPLCPQEDKQKLDEVLKSLQHFCSGEAGSVPIPTQKSILETVMLLTPYHAALATDICQKWLTLNSEGADKSTIDTVKEYLTYYKQRLPYIAV